MSTLFSICTLISIYNTYGQNALIPTESDLLDLELILMDAYKSSSDEFCDFADPNDDSGIPSSLCDDLLPFAGSALRLVFHDCGGPPDPSASSSSSSSITNICDGCIELDGFDDHNGLPERAVERLESIYLDPDNKWNDKMSRADFWIFAGSVAIKTAGGPLITNFFGRTQCDTSPDLDNSDTVHNEFPLSIGGWIETFEWLGNAFGLTKEETVAIMGAHTMGSAHQINSGFTGAWLEPWGIFDNQYYNDIINVEWSQQDAPGVNAGGNKEWTASSGIHMMMNPDIGLFKDLSNHDSKGAVPCGDDYSSCPTNTETAQFVQAFADDNDKWFEVFSSAYTKMITIGYNDGDLTIVGPDLRQKTTDQLCVAIPLWVNNEPNSWQLSGIYTSEEPDINGHTVYKRIDCNTERYIWFFTGTINGISSETYVITSSRPASGITITFYSWCSPDSDDPTQCTWNRDNIFETSVSSSIDECGCNTEPSSSSLSSAMIKPIMIEPVSMINTDSKSIGIWNEFVNIISSQYGSLIILTIIIICIIWTVSLCIYFAFLKQKNSSKGYSKTNVIDIDE